MRYVVGKMSAPTEVKVPHDFHEPSAHLVKVPNIQLSWPLEKWSNPLNIFAVNQTIVLYVHVFFFWWPSLCATLYLPMKTVKELCVSLPMSAVVLSFCLPLLVQSLILTGKPNCIKVNHVVSMINTPTILVKLLQMIWCYVTRFMVCQPVWLFLWIFKKISISHHNGIMSHTPNFRRGTWSSSYYRGLEKRLGYLNLRDDQKRFCLVGTWSLRWQRWPLKTPCKYWFIHTTTTNY